MKFGRIVTAMVTPFDQQGDIDYPATKNLIEHLIANGSDSILVAGTTGESPTLSDKEKLALFSFVVKEAGGRVPIIAGTGSNNTKESVAMTKEAAACGVDGIMLVVPYYNKPSQEGMYQHFKMIAENADNLPIMLYNIPGRTSSNMLPETVIRLAHDVDNIVCVKEASGDLDAMAEIIAATDSDFLLYSGDDSLTLPSLAIGGTGVVSVASHIIGLEMQKMIQAFFAGEILHAGEIHRAILPVCQALFAAPNPTPLKAVLNMNGIAVGGVRLPLVPLTVEERRELVKKVQLHRTWAS